MLTCFEQTETMSDLLLRQENFKAFPIQPGYLLEFSTQGCLGIPSIYIILLKNVRATKLKTTPKSACYDIYECMTSIFIVQHF